jgi:hypothetical protein
LLTTYLYFTLDGQLGRSDIPPTDEDLELAANDDIDILKIESDLDGIRTYRYRSETSRYVPVKIATINNATDTPFHEVKENLQ